MGDAVTRRRLLAFALALLAMAAGAVPASAQPVVQAHRGGPYAEGAPVHPENTMPAFRAAADGGFVLEMDAEITRDRVPVVLHDSTLDRTTNCAGPVGALTAAELAERCRADVLGSPGNAGDLPVRELPGSTVRVPTLAEVLAFARDREARINLEIKNIPTERSFDPTPAYANAVLDVVDASAIPRALVIIQSFSPNNLQVAEERGFETSLLTLNPTNPGGPEFAKANRYEWLSPGFPVDQATVSRAHTLGLRVVPYTLDRAEELRAAAGLGVDEIITDDPALAARVLAGTGPREPAIPRAPGARECAGTRASRTLAPIQAYDPKPGAPRVFAMQFKQDARHVVTYESFRTKIECMVREMVVPRLARDRPNVIAFNEDIGLATIATGTRGRVARDLFTGRDSPSCNGAAGAPCGAFGALTAVGAAYAREQAAYRTRFPDLSPVSGTFVATTDTFARGWMQVFSDIARRYGVYILGSNNQAPFRESTDPADIAAFADPDLPRPDSVFVATAPQVYNEVFMWGPRDVRTGGPRPLRNVVTQNKKVPLTPIEELLQLTNGPSRGPDAIENVEPYALPGTDARISFATSLPAFVYGELPAGTDPCSDVARFYMRCLDRLGTNLVMQDEANPGKWAAYTGRDGPDRGAWQTLSWNTSTWRAAVDPTVRFDYNVTPHLVGNLGDLPFDGQTAITQRGLGSASGVTARAAQRRRACNYVGSGAFVAGADPEQVAIGGETFALRPFAGPKTEFVAMVPWVRDDAPRAELARTADALSPEGGAALENDYLETAIAADLPFPPDPNRPSCATASAASATSGARRRARPRARIRLRVTPRRARTGRRTRLRFTARAGGRAAARVDVRLAGRRVRTDRRGRASMVIRFRRPGRFRAVATRSGLRRGTAGVRVSGAVRPRYAG